MRIRSIKPEFFCDEILDELPAEVRLAYAGLWCYCDDSGRGFDDRWLIKAAIAPRRDKDTPDRVEGWLRDLARAGRIIRYEIGGRRYLQIAHWEHQRINNPTTSKIPPPPLTESSRSPTVALTESSPRAREEVEVEVEREVEVEVEREVEGKGKGMPPAPQDGGSDEKDFADSFWPLYPERNGKKLDKAKTLLAWNRLSKTERSLALVGVGHYRAAVDEGLTLAKDPLRWLQGKCWEDWQEPAKPSLPPSPNGHHGAATANGTSRNGFDLAAARNALTGYLAAHVVAEIEGSLAESGPVTARRLVGAAKARGRSMQPPVRIPEIEEL